MRYDASVSFNYRNQESLNTNIQSNYRQNDINKAVKAIHNPFEEQPNRMSEYTAVEIATLQSRLDRQLGPEYISTRSGPGGGKIHYLAAEKVINLANEVFGFNGWSSALQQIQVDFVSEQFILLLVDFSN